MKKYLEKLFILLFVSILLVPNFVFAEKDEEEKEEAEEKNPPVQIYEFYGSTCGYCASLNEFLDSIEEEYGEYFDVTKFEVWSSEENAELMESAAEVLNADVTGVPFLIIGEKYLTGFNESNKETIINYIMEEYEKPDYERYNLLTEIENYDATAKDKEKRTNTILTVSSIVLLVGTVFVVIKARKED